MEARISEEWNEIISKPIPNIEVALVNDDMKTWAASIIGPKDTPYEGGVFVMAIIFPENYPVGPPLFAMVTPVFHVNIHEKGLVCLDIVKTNSKPENKVGYMISCITWLLANPNPNDHFNTAAKALFISDRKAYDEFAKKMTTTFSLFCI